MTGRLLVLVAAAALGAIAAAAYMIYRRRWAETPERLPIDELGLELMSGCCAFVIFTSPSCRPCKTAIAVVQKVVASSSAPTEVVTVDATQDPELALELGIRTIPTIFLITASGHVVERWKDVPEIENARSALASI
jgi:thiol-disulfide isomerase/thioredoxin